MRVDPWCVGVCCLFTHFGFNTTPQKVQPACKRLSSIAMLWTKFAPLDTRNAV